jgi:hypothetical protein
MIPMMMFSMKAAGLDLLAGPHEDDHEGKEADGGDDAEDIRHNVYFFLGIG